MHLTPSHQNTKFDSNLEFIAQKVVDTAVKLHMQLGPGLLESVYESVLAKRLEKLGFMVERQKPIPIIVDDLQFDEGFRADLVINQCFVVELKSVEHLAPGAGQTVTHLSAPPQSSSRVIN